MPTLKIAMMAVVLCTATFAEAQTAGKRTVDAGTLAGDSQRGVAVGSKLFVPRTIGRWLDRARVRSDGAVAATIDDAGLIVLWDIKRRRAFDTVPLRGNAVALAPDKPILAFIRPNDGGPEIVIYDYQKHAIVERIASRAIKVDSKLVQGVFPTDLHFDDRNGRLFVTTGGDVFGELNIARKTLKASHAVSWQAVERYSDLAPSSDARFAIGGTYSYDSKLPFEGLVRLDMATRKVKPLPLPCFTPDGRCFVNVIGLVDDDSAAIFWISDHGPGTTGRVDLSTGEITWKINAAGRKSLWVREGADARFFTTDGDENPIEVDLKTGKVSPVDDPVLAPLITLQITSASSPHGAVIFDTTNGKLLSVRCADRCRTLDVDEMQGLSATITGAWRVDGTSDVVLASRDRFVILDTQRGILRPTAATTPSWGHPPLPLSGGTRILTLRVEGEDTRTARVRIFDLARQTWEEGASINVDPYTSSSVAVPESDYNYLFVEVLNRVLSKFFVYVYQHDQVTGRVIQTDILPEGCEHNTASYVEPLETIAINCSRADFLTVDPVTGKISGKLEAKNGISARGLVVNDSGTRAIVGRSLAPEGAIRPLDLRKKSYGKSAPGTEAGNVLVRLPGDKAISGGEGGQVVELDVNSGQILRRLPSHATKITGAVPLPDKDRLVTTSEDGTVNILELSSGAVLATLVVENAGRRLIYTPELFFDAPEDMARQVGFQGRGMEIISLSRDIRALYRPDLVQEKLAGDPTGKVREAARRTGGKRIVDESRLPSVKLAHPGEGAKLGASVEAVAEITDPVGEGGRIEWRLNGFVIGIDAITATGKPLTARTTRTIALQTGVNAIEVSASGPDVNAAYAEPARVQVTGQGSDEGRGRLFLVGLVTGDETMRMAATAEVSRSQSAFARQSSSLYRSVEARLIDDATTAERVRERIEAIAGEMGTNDSLLFQVAGTGRLDGNSLALALPGDAQIAGDELERLVALMPPRKVLLVYDLLEASSAGADTRGDDVRALMATERLTRATGRSALVLLRPQPLAELAVASPVTDALVRGLSDGDLNGDGEIDITELLSFAETDIRDGSRKQATPLTPYLRVIGSDWPIAVGERSAPRNERRDTTPTHVLIADTVLRDKPSPTAKDLGNLDAGTSAYLVSVAAGWALLARNGSDIGFVPEEHLVQIQY
ncbi:hypothetical protein [Ancylobacter sp. TS-1]|uniref:hypothetical protein n=1 Tax=Ancylobacter sp. TS-1 TaxID=1850374 RepID=UPI001265C95A|nr:hypothetical protein [Ancylobacter sp. TS-1]QFR33416.1 hypothetical protein GBB76_09880 [Ancylobacter sp. TS-1]